MNTTGHHTEPIHGPIGTLDEVLGRSGPDIYQSERTNDALIACFGKISASR